MSLCKTRLTLFQSEWSVLSSHTTAAWGLNCAEHLTHLILYCYFGSSHFSCLHHSWNYWDHICSEQQCLLWLWPVSWKTKELLWSLYVSAQCRFGTLPLHNLTAPVECEYTTQYGSVTQMQLQPGSIGQANQCVLQHWCFSNSTTSILSGRFCFMTHLLQQKANACYHFVFQRVDDLLISGQI